MIELIPLKDLVLDPTNARKHNKKNLDAIKGSLKKFGQQKPIVVTEEGVVIAGNGTLAAAQALGWADIQVIRSKLTGSDITAYAIADNRTGELAEWDLNILPGTLEALSKEFDIGEIGFDKDDLARLTKEEIKPGLTEDDSIPEQIDTRCKLGDLWVLGEHRLVCGDSTDVLQVERLMGGEKADMVFTDPPYNVAFNGRSGKHKVIMNDNLPEHEFGDFISNVCQTILTINAPISYIWCNWKFYGILQDRIPYKACIVWAKNVFGLGSGYRHQHEFCLFNGAIDSDIKNESDLWECKKDTNYVHPTQKPVDLAERAFKNHAKAKNILDLFLGSGSTLIACEKTGRKCYGMELDPHYCDVILTRWEKFTGKSAILSSNGDSFDP